MHIRCSGPISHAKICVRRPGASGCAFLVLRNTHALPAFSFNNLSWSSAMEPYRYEPNAPQKSRMDQATEIGQEALGQVSEAQPLSATP